MVQTKSVSFKLVGVSNANAKVMPPPDDANGCKINQAQNRAQGTI